MGKLLDLLDETANMPTSLTCTVDRVKRAHPDLADDIDRALYERRDKSATTVHAVFEQLDVPEITVGMIRQHRRGQCQTCR